MHFIIAFTQKNDLTKNNLATQKIFNTLNKVCMVLHTGVTRVVPGLLPRWS